MKLASVRIYLRGPDICLKGSSSSSHLVAHQVAGASGRRSGRGRCGHLKYIPFWQGDIVPQQYGYLWKVYKKVELNFRWSVQILVPWGGGAGREGLGSMPEWQVGINSHK